MGTFRQRALTSACAAFGMIALPAVHWAFDDYGPASRVVVHEYLFSPSFLGIVLAGAVVGVSLGAELPRFLRAFRGSGQGYSVLRVACGCLGGGALAVVPGVRAAIAIDPQAQSFSPLAMATFFAVVGVGAWLGGALLFKSTDAPTSTRGPPWKRLVALAVVAAAITNAQLRAFPSSGTAAEREAWARARVREYPSLARIVSRLPQVTSDVGRVVTIAPTAHDRHSYATDMDGDHLHFTLDVVGERGAGIFLADGTITSQGLPAEMSYWISDWRSGVWTFGGTTTHIDPR